MKTARSKAHNKAKGKAHTRANGAGKQPSKQSGQCRIIAGKYRRRILEFHDAEGLRPTTDRIRETLFNWLTPYLSGKNCLDAYAGSGALGFEAVSRGCKSVLQVELHKPAVVDLISNKKNILDAQDTDEFEIIEADVNLWLTSAMNQNTKLQFDLVFLDPPYHKGLLDKTIGLLDQGEFLTQDALVYIEHAIDETFQLPSGWQLVKSSKTASIVYALYTVSGED